MAHSSIPSNLERFSGLGECCHAHRPAPPPALVDCLCRIAGVGVPPCVVDLGCGTGLSTRIWSGRAAEVIGIEPNPDMRARAEWELAQHERTGGTEIHYLEGLSTATGLPEGSADVWGPAGTLVLHLPDALRRALSRPKE